MTRIVPFEHRGRRFEVRIEPDGALALYLQGCLRKRREASPRAPQYVWTNVELEWEEHHYVEVRYWAAQGLLRVWINRHLTLEQRHPVS